MNSSASTASTGTNQCVPLPNDDDIGEVFEEDSDELKFNAKQCEECCEKIKKLVPNYKIIRENAFLSLF